MLEGRRGRWGCELKRLFGPDMFDHVIYFDTVGCAHSGRLQRVVITDRHLYMFDDNVKVKPKPFCLLVDIKDLDTDDETPQAYRIHPEYDSHHIYFNLEDIQYHIYTFESGTDLFWRLKSAIEIARRDDAITEKRKEATPPDMVELVEVDGRKMTINTYYTQQFNYISSRVVHAKSHHSRMKALKELEEISAKYFPIRTIFFQSTTLLTYLIDTLTFLSDFHTVPTQIKSNRLEQIELINSIYNTFSYYLQGMATVPDSTRLITFNKACHYKTLVHSIFQTEFFLLSQPSRSHFFFSVIPDKEKYMAYLQEIESTVVTLCANLNTLALLTWRTTHLVSQNFFLEVIKEKENMVISGGFHTIVYMLIQLCYAMPSMQPLPPFFSHSIYDHLWLIDYFMTNLQSAKEFVFAEFLSEFDLIVTETRMKDMIPENFTLRSEIFKLVQHIRSMLRFSSKMDKPYTKMPVQFR
ncbi:hypothetical protein TRFO_28295 [Tritrichomonas foetus]|uniref:Uncharacterized protein n=1 Tax=Tritrichomonas foetus TaxID=1144522 RepID=A0A1J4K3E2_9EUKA|nr:hypothetical protein TRFO_28295 [Tritrichomonas foetus]|eukprot:OHT04246.1 hypothetical protein TRFO_28295 [Tritrichomonas foetus]